MRIYKSKLYRTLFASTLGVFIFCYALSACAQSSHLLIGVVHDPSGKPVARVNVRAVGIGTDSSTDSGEFIFQMTEDQVGTPVQIEVMKKGWKAINEWELRPIVPRDAKQNPVHIVISAIDAPPKAALPIEAPGETLVNVRARVDGYIAEVRFRNGQSVKMGDVLVVVDPSDARLQVEAADAQLKKYDVYLAEANSALETAQQKLANHLATQIEVDDATTKRDDVEALRLQRKQSRDAALLFLSRTVLRAPADGIVTNAAAHVGDHLDNGDLMLSICQRSRL